MFTQDLCSLTIKDFVLLTSKTNINIQKTKMFSQINRGDCGLDLEVKLAIHKNK